MYAVGDLLKSPRGLYAHYGVFFGGGHVLEFAGDRAKHVASARPRWSTLERFADGRAVIIVEHSNAAPQELRRRADQVLAEHRSYNLLSYNCEHLARYVALGDRRSMQANNATTVAFWLFAFWLFTD